jgi:anaerobic magnesium-protoporphyrin IX monomethyl ester cyclase
MNFLLIRATQGVSLFLKKTPQTAPYPFSPPLDLLYLASGLETTGHTAIVLDLSAEPQPKDILQHSLTGIDVAILRVTLGSHHAPQSIAAFIHDHDPHIPILLIGTYCQTRPGHALKDIPSAKISIDTEAEFHIPSIINTLTGHQPLSSTPGISYRDHEIIKQGPSTSPTSDLDILPFPARHLVSAYDYGRFNGIHLSKPPFTSLMTSRGCPFHCRFCTSHIISPSYRTRTPANVLDELIEISSSHHSVMIEDNNFLADIPRAHTILDGLINHGAPLDLYVAGARVDTANRDLYQKMKQAGVKFISYGFESGSQEILDFYHKRITISQIETAVKLAKDAGLITWGNFIIGAPHETKDQINKTFTLASRLPLDMVFYRTLLYQSGSDLWKDAVKNGSITEIEDVVAADARRNLALFTKQELAGFSQKAILRFYLRPTYLARELYRALKNQDVTMAKALYGFLHTPRLVSGPTI